MSAGPAETDLPPALVDWIGAQLGAAVTAVDKVPGGASRLSYLIQAGSRAAFLRRDTGTGQLSGTAYNLAREARVLASLAGGPVAVARVLGFNTDHQSVLMERVAGTTDYFSVSDPAARAALEGGLIGQLAALHALPLDTSVFGPGLFGGAAALSRGEAVRADIALWRDLYRSRVAVSDPALDLALDWLDRSVPGADEPAVLVHGDIGPGNFMFDGDRITALIDWELVHPGHPLEDLASVIARTLGVPFGDNEAHVAAYGRASGHPVDRGALTYCLALVLTRFCIGMAIGLSMARPEMDLGMLVRYFQVNRHALLRLLARCQGLPVPAGVPATLPAGEHEAAPLYDHAIHVVEELGAAGDAFARHRGTGIANLLRYLRDLAAYGSDRWQQEQRELVGALLDGPPPATAAEAARRFAAAVPGMDEARRRTALARLLEQSGRRQALMRAALGPMFDRSIDME